MLKFTIYGLQTYIQQIQNGYIKRSSSAIHSRLDCEMWKRSIKSPWYALSSHSITMWSIVWFGLPRSQPGLGSFLHLWRLWAHTPCPVLIRFKVFHICRGWSKPSGFTTGSMRFLTSGGAFSVQSFCHSDLMLKLLAASLLCWYICRFPRSELVYCQIRDILMDRELCVLNYFLVFFYKGVLSS